MPEFALPPYYHPTTVAFVDDNQSFLESLELEIPASLAYRIYTDAETALASLNQPPAMPPLVDRCFKLQNDARENAVIHLDLSLVEQEINYPQRFERVSVVVIDYAMPSLDGLMLCERLRDPYLKRAMLTGVADEKIAVDAFNAGLIDRFLPKHAGDSNHRILQMVSQLQHEYFTQYTARLRNTLAIRPPGFLIDPAMADYVNQHMARQQHVEYYLVTDPPGYLLLTASGKTQRMLILDEEQYDRQVDFIRAQDPPAEIAAGFERREIMGLFTDSPEHYFGNEAYPWHENVVPLVMLAGSGHNWYVAVVDDPPIDIDFDPVESSYATYLKRSGFV